MIIIGICGFLNDTVERGVIEDLFQHDPSVSYFRIMRGPFAVFDLNNNDRPFLFVLASGNEGQRVAKRLALQGYTVVLQQFTVAYRKPLYTVGEIVMELRRHLDQETLDDHRNELLAGRVEISLAFLNALVGKLGADVTANPPSDAEMAERVGMEQTLTTDRKGRRAQFIRWMQMIAILTALRY